VTEPVRTESDSVPAGRRRPEGQPQLFVALVGDRPQQVPSRHLLDGIDQVTIGRDARAGASRTSRKGLQVLELRLDDRLASAAHARIERLAAGRWAIVDAGAKNGLHVNGERVPRAILLDGDLIEIGGTVLLYRDAVPPVQADAADLDGGRLVGPSGLVTFAAGLAETWSQAERAAASLVPVVILGDSGTGKELVARAIHACSGRSGAFVAVNCGAIPDTLVEATILGHRKGAFSGATDDRPGVVRSADRGTLFLDEIGDLRLSSQTALLRVLQESEVVPVGDTRAVKVDTRVVCATHRPLGAMVAAGEFRADLYARIAGITLRLPPLVDRREDLGLLIAAFLARLGEPGRRATFTRAAARALFLHDWPLNVRELQQVITAAVALAPDGVIEVEHLSESLRDGGASAAADAPPATTELSAADQRLRGELISLLTEHRGKVSAVASVMGKGRMQIHRWAKRFGIDLDAYRR